MKDLKSLEARHNNSVNRGNFEGNTYNEVVNRVLPSVLEAYLYEHALTSEQSLIQRELFNQAWTLMRDVLHNGGTISTSGECKPSPALAEESDKSLPIIGMEEEQTSDESDKSIPIIFMENEQTYVLPPGIDKLIRMGNSTKEGMTFILDKEQSDIVMILDYVARKNLGPHYPLTIKTVVVQLLADIAHTNKLLREKKEQEDYYQEKLAAGRRTQAQVLNTTPIDQSSQNGN